MAIAYTWVFLALLAAYMVYSRWAHWDGRYLVVAAVVLFGITAVAYAELDTWLANTLVVYALFLFGAAVVLLMLDLGEGREAARLLGTAPREEAVAPPVDHPGARQPSPQDALDRLEQ